MSLRLAYFSASLSLLLIGGCGRTALDEDGGTVPFDAAGQDLTGADLSRGPDFRIPFDIAGVDTASPDLSSGCGIDPCGPCMFGCLPNDQCINGKWICDCICGSIDIAVPRDGSVIDISIPKDGSTVDISVPRDMTTPPDIAQPRDMASPCGLPGQACCGGACNAGGCCSNNVCLASGDTCGMGEVCADGTCNACGGAGQPCCEKNTCSGAGCCAQGTCVSPGQDCGGGFGICQNSSCGGTCGGLGQLCCVTPNPLPNFCSSAGTYCAGPNLPGTCEPCGGPGQSCCNDSVCDSGGCCVQGLCHSAGTSCGITMCVNHSCGGGTCGSIGQPCCGGGTICTGPHARCRGGSCVACGGQGEPCCFDAASGRNIACDPPFQPSGFMMCTCQ